MAQHIPSKSGICVNTSTVDFSSEVNLLKEKGARAPFGKDAKVTFLAPMQDISDAGFMGIFADFGSPDFYAAEYFRIHEYFEFEKSVMESVLARPAGRPVCAQFIGEDEFFMTKAVRELKKYPEIKMLDLNFGCPAPKIYKKNAGGGLLRNPEKIKSLMRIIREEWEGCLSVKMRIGFESALEFPTLLNAVLENSPDFITVHARTVRQLYRGTPDYNAITYAVKNSPVPIIANGDIISSARAKEVFEKTKCAGVMCGRHAVRNPWIFRQIKEMLSGREIFRPSLADVRVYVDRLRANIENGEFCARYPDSRMKKFLNFVGLCVDSKGEFLYKMRRARGMAQLMKVCDEFLIENSNAERLFADEPYDGLCSRPNHEERPNNE